MSGSDSTVQNERVKIIQNIIRKQLHVKALIQDIQDVVEDEKSLERTHRHVQKEISDICTLTEELLLLAHEQDRECDKLAVLADVKEHKQQMANLQQMLRKANLVAQVQVEKMSRESLFYANPNEESTAESVRQRIVLKDKESAKQLSSTVTNDLLSISRSLATQVKQSEETLQTLVQSSQVVSDTQEEFKSMGGVIQQSRKLLSKYSRREFTDKVLIVLALAFFFACVLYVMTKRAL